MRLKDRLKLYSGILFSKSGNSLDVRFKLVRTIAKHGPANFYTGLRVDNIYEADFVIAGSGVCADYNNPDKIIFFATPRNVRRHNLKESIFRLDDNVYYDVTDGVACRLIDRFNHEAEYGCCNLQKVKHCSELVGVKSQRLI